MTGPPASEQVYRFPYPRVMVFALLVVVTFAFGHSLNTYRIVREMSADGRALASDPWPWVRWMMAVSVGLAAFVLGALVRRRALRLTVGPQGLGMEKLTLGKRRRELAWDDVRRVSVERGMGSSWTLSITGADGAKQRFPLAHAVGQGKALGSRSDRAAVEAHPLVEAIRDAIGPRFILIG